MASVFDTAKYILNRFGKRMTTFKLQKLVYYSQAWSLVWDEKPLFKDKIYAWANGPVCVELYKKHKGKYEIVEKDINGDGKLTNLSDKQQTTIDSVLSSYKHFTGQQLCNMTHNEAPWKNARKGLAIDERGNNEITLDSMLEHFSAIYSAQTK